MNYKQIHPVIQEVTQEIIARSKTTRAQYLARMQVDYGIKVHRAELGCTNLAHATASEENPVNKLRLKKIEEPNIAIVTSYNDMLSAHHPYYLYPTKIKQAVSEVGATAQVASGVPAMCDGVTQGQVGMELSLFSRDLIAMATAVGLSHKVFDGALCLGICDKIVPGLLIGALSFGYLPTIFVPGGPMPSGIPNKQKAHTRSLFAAGEVGKEELLASEMASYHAPGVCTFYGTANSNQMLMEIMGLHIPGSAFVMPNTPLRDMLTAYAAKRVVAISHSKAGEFTPLCEVVNEYSIVNAIIGLLATGGSSNHTIHLPAIAKACGIIINWDDFAKLAKVIPLLAKIYPNADADINSFHAAGGVAFVIKSLLEEGLLHDNVTTVMGKSLSQHYISNPHLVDNKLVWIEATNQNETILHDAKVPFSPDGGLKLLMGNLGRGVSKVSAIKLEQRYVKAPAKVFTTQEAVTQAFEKGELNQDCIVVLTYQGPKANGMPELHGLTPLLSSLQDKGFAVGLITDGRMSGASGKVPNAIHITPEALDDGVIAKIHEGDIIELDLNNGIVEVHVSSDELAKRDIIKPDLASYEQGYGRELFKMFRANVSNAEAGATSF